MVRQVWLLAGLLLRVVGAFLAAGGLLVTAFTGFLTMCATP